MRKITKVINLTHRRSIQTVNTQSQAVENTEVQKHFNFIAAVRNRPNLAKSPRGEDSYLISECGRAVAMADGVHRTNTAVDSSLYSRMVYLFTIFIS